jgi:hypothetical protein
VDGRETLAEIDCADAAAWEAFQGRFAAACAARAV